jgi:hypothetical protein
LAAKGLSLLIGLKQEDKMKVVQWKEQVTQSGITLAGTSTTVFKRGEILGTQAFPVQDAAGRQGIATILIVRAFEDGRIFGIDAALCQYVDDSNSVEPLKKTDVLV